MKILSTKLLIKRDIEQSKIENVIVKWLTDSAPCREIGELYKNREDKKEICLQTKYCRIDTFQTENENGEFRLFKLEHKYYDQVWITELIQKITGLEHNLYVHIECNGNITRFDKVPKVRTEIIRLFVDSECIRQTVLPITSRPIHTNKEIEDIIVDAVNGEYNCPLPMIFATKIFDRAGYEINAEGLANRLAGVAYVVVEHDDGFVRNLKERTNGTNPYNGHVAVYFPENGRTKSYNPDEYIGWGMLDKAITDDVIQYVIAQTDSDAPTWRGLHTEKMSEEVREKSELLQEFDTENGTLGEQLKQAQKKILALTARLEMLENSQKINGGLLNTADVVEFYDYEQYDLVITILNAALGKYAAGTRAYELLTKILEANPLKGYGKEIFERIKSVFSNGEGIKDKEFAELRELGFDVVSEKNHYKIVFKGDERYWFPIAKTPSDMRSGKNLASDITKKLSVYK